MSNKRSVIFICLGIGVYILITFLTGQDQIGTMRLTELFQDSFFAKLFMPWRFLGFRISVRQWAHIYEFLILSVLIQIGIFHMYPKLKWLGIFGTAVLSFIDQVHRLYIPGREFDWVDLILDFIGYAIGFVLVWGGKKISDIISKRK